MHKEIEIAGCVEIPPDMPAEAFEEAFVEWVEEHGWFFGGGFREIVDGHYINPNGTKGNHVLED